MKNCIPIILACLCVCLLLGCHAEVEPGVTTDPTTTHGQPTEPTEESTTLPTEPEQPTEPPTPEHSPLYIPDLSVEDVITYFKEVCLDAEYVTSGNPSVIQKWTKPIYYQINGEPTDEDLAVLAAFTEWLCGIEGFPGIYQAETHAAANLQIHFCTNQQMLNILGSNFYNCDGGVTFWYNGNNQIYNEIICYRTDIGQHLRNSVILEEIYNGLGPVQDSDLREDSIIYSGFSEPQALTEIDALLLRLLYHPDIQCGMDAQRCEAIIRQLYY